MRRDAQQHSFSVEDHDTLRAQVRDVLAAEGLSQAAAARQAGIANSTFAAWLANTYQGNQDKVGADVQIWLTSRAEQAKAALARPNAPGFLPLPTASAVLDVLRYAQVGPDFVAVAGAPGIGKTTAATHYARNNPNVWLITAQPSTASLHRTLEEIAAEMGIEERNAARLLRSVERKLRSVPGGLLVVDEAQFLEAKTVEQLRILHDRHEVGVALLGNETVYAKIEGKGRTPEFAQLWSRIGMRIVQSKPRPGDVCGLLDGWGITEDDQRRLLKSIAERGGALRAVHKVLCLASVLAAGANEALSLRMIQAAWQQLSRGGRPE